MTFTDFLKILSNAKMVIATITVIITSFIGAYQLAGEYFVTKAYAAGFEKNAQQQIHQLKKLTQQNTLMMFEFQALKYEDKMLSGQALTPTQQRQYDLIKKQLENLKQINPIADTPVPLTPTDGG